MGFPTLANAYLENGIDQGVKRQRMQDQLEATLQLIGAGPVQNLTLAGDAITPAAGASGSIMLDTQGAAASDDLKNIATTNLPDGALIVLRIADNGRVINAKHNAGGAGQIALAGAGDFQLNRIEQELWLRRAGANWIEMFRSGREKDHIVGGSGEPAFNAGWSNPTAGNELRFHRDNEGVVTLRGVARIANMNAASMSPFTLPAGWNNPQAAGPGPFACWALVGATWEVLRVDIDSFSAVNVTRSAAPNAQVDVYFDGVGFRR